MSQTVVMDICRMSMKLCKEVLYGITLAIEQLVLQNSARLLQHTASASVASTLSTGAATFGNLFSMVFKPDTLSAQVTCVCSSQLQACYNCQLQKNVWGYIFVRAFEWMVS